MKINTVIAAMIILFVGFGGGYVLAGNKEIAHEPMPSMQQGHTMSDTMSGMTEGLEGKVGDEFDRAFIAEMIVHHEGAVAMARLAQQAAGHSEIKQMANEIISAQTREIETMQEWQKEWYGIEE